MYAPEVSTKVYSTLLAPFGPVSEPIVVNLWLSELELCVLRVGSARLD